VEVVYTASCVPKEKCPVSRHYITTYNPLSLQIQTVYHLFKNKMHATSVKREEVMNVDIVRAWGPEVLSETIIYKKTIIVE
jgi:hypothetical protein